MLSYGTRKHRIPALPSSEEEDPSSAGTFQHIGKYQVIRPIARGGMAELFLASTGAIEGCEKPVVIKRMLPKLAADHEYVEMFLNEARVVARLNHPNIVHFYEIGSLDGEYFIAMEYLQGCDTLRLLRVASATHRRIPLDATVTIGLAMCSALQYAHTRKDEEGRPLNIVHRDVSPQNVFLTFEGGVKLLDFGIAKAASQVTETRQGTLKGKLSYMSPEQARGERPDGRNDLFSLAVVLWELTTSAKLFHGKNDYELLKQLLEAEIPRPSTSDASCPADLERIIMKGLSRDATERYQTADELQSDLERFARELKLAVSPRSVSALLKDFFGEAQDSWSRGRGEPTPGFSRSGSNPKRRGGSDSLAENAGDETRNLSLPMNHSARRWALLGVAMLLAALMGASIVRWRGPRAVTGPPAVPVAAPAAHDPAPAPPAPSPVVQSPTVETKPAVPSEAQRIVAPERPETRRTGAAGTKPHRAPARPLWPEVLDEDDDMPLPPKKTLEAH